ncbi:2TM domain-containing protein [Aequorivita capsosiphonis]|uniref:2TM domain-containing protein n=1 Tax=Aequorivita capsosiphonis TaxID=487317 RepID=UPI0004116DE2|nr:2TM domain-containing protein [Aequorivita capsosiphonis]
MEYSDRIKLRRAHKRVEALKGFYKHLLIYCIVNLALFIVRGNILQFFQSETPDKNFIAWIDWNILIVPVFWGIWLLFHAAKVFSYKLKFIENWEKRQMEKFLNEQ